MIILGVGVGPCPSGSAGTLSSAIGATRWQRYTFVVTIQNSKIPPLRIREVNAAPVNPAGEYVLYWMIAFRRTTWNFSLDRAVEWARELNKPLLVFEPLRCGYKWASDRLHRFVIDGMADNAERLAASGVLYYPYLEPANGDAKGLLVALASRAAVVVTDDFPCFFLPQMVEAAGKQLPVRLEAIDSNGILPMRAADREFTVAHSFRRWLQNNLRPPLSEFPCADALEGAKLPALKSLPPDIARRWPAAEVEKIASKPGPLARFPIDHTVLPTATRGGATAAANTLVRFLNKRLANYHHARNEPDEEGASGLSPYLHFGHISAHEVFHAATWREKWSLADLAEKANGKATGWWRTSEALEAFLEELIVWRELGFNMCSRRADYDQFDSLPNWARQTLAKHAADPREYVYTLAQFEQSLTHDELWNAAQRQLVRDGRIHNYLRMLWGKKILEWSPTPRAALDTMIELNNKYALDGRDPNSYSGIFWVLGRYDRAWGPQRPIFGTVRYMSSENTARKVSVKKYLQRYGE